MNREIKLLKTCLSDFYGGICAYIDLDDYADKDSVRCTLANFNTEIFPDKFGFDGTPYFSDEKFKKYSNGDYYRRIYVEIEYSSKKLELDESVFNTANGITNYVKDLETLHHIINIRSVAYNKKKIKLQEFVWKGLIALDKFGQTMTLTKRNNVYLPESLRNEAVDIHLFRKHCRSYSGSFGKVPTHDEICPVCGEKWGIDNIHDYVTIEKEYKSINFHIDCLRAHKKEQQLKEFQTIFSKIYNIEELYFYSIPNEYCSCVYCPPWFMVSTPDGNIKIGWRKRVINIEWLENYKNFKDVFLNETVTKGFGKYGEERYIHASTVDKAIKYIKLAKENINK